MMIQSLPTPAPADGLHRQGGRWTKGRSGNPAGRRHGSRNKATVALERIMAADAADVVRATVEAAKAGDMQAARLILDRVLPPRKGRPVRLDLPAIATAADVLHAQAAVVAAMAGGELTPDEAGLVAGVLEARRKAIETVELEARVAALEAQPVREREAER